MLPGTPRSPDADPGDVDLLDDVEGRTGVSGQQARETWGETSSNDDVTRPLTGFRIELEQRPHVPFLTGH
jgi:hypothetical protein